MSKSRTVLHYHLQLFFDWLHHARKSIQPTPDFTYESSSLTEKQLLEHLGILKDERNHVKLEGRIKKARNALYALFGAGLHGRNGLPPGTSLHIWLAYVEPILLYGLETVLLTKKELDVLLQFERKTLKELQFLPIRTSNAITYLLLGKIPIVATLHKRILTLFGTITRSAECPIREIAIRQLAIKNLDNKSWFSQVRTLLLQYGLPTAYDLILDPFPKNRWKKMLDEAVNNFWEHTLKDEASDKSSLEYINLVHLSIGSVHQVWTTVKPNTFDVQRASVKARLLTGTYMLQTNKAVFNQFKVKATCYLCNDGDETRLHFIVICSALQGCRDKYITRLMSICGTELVNLFWWQYFHLTIVGCHICHHAAGVDWWAAS